MKLNKLLFSILLLSLLVLSPVMAESLVDADLIWPAGVAPNIQQGDILEITARLSNHGADYLKTVVELRRIDGQPITTVTLGNLSLDVMMVPVYENNNILDLLFVYPIKIPTTSFTYAGDAFDLPEADYSLTIKGYAYKNNQLHSQDTDVKYVTIDPRDVTLPNLIVDVNCQDAVQRGETLTCDIYVEDDSNNNIEGALVEFQYAENTCTTNTLGYCQINYVIPDFFADGTYNAIFTATKTNYNPGSATETFEVYSTIPTPSLHITSVYCDSPVYFGEEAICTAVVVDDSNVIVSDAQVEFSINAYSLGETQYSTNYFVNYVADFISGEGDYNVRISADKAGYNGDVEYVTVTFLETNPEYKDMNIVLNCNDSIHINEELLCKATVTETTTKKFLGLIPYKAEIPVVGAIVQFSINNTEDPFIVTQTITDEDGVSTFNREILFIHGYIPGNSYAVQAVASKDNYNPAFATEIFNILDGAANARINYPEDPYQVNQIVKFDGYQSTGIDGTYDSIESCKWNVDGMKSEPLHCDIEYQFKTEGTYLITLWIKDQFGYEDTDSVQVTVINGSILTDPVALIRGPETSTVGYKVQFSGSDSFTAIGHQIVNYIWSITDQNDLAIVDNWNNGAILPHTFEETGNYTITLTVVDDRGLQNTATHRISISEAIPQPVEGFLDLESGIKVISFNLYGFDDAKVGVGEDFQIRAIIENVADKELEGVRMSFYLPEFGVKFTSSAHDIDEGERQEYTINGYLPYDIQPNIYYPLIGFSDDHIRRIKIGYMEVVEG